MVGNCSYAASAIAPALLYLLHPCSRKAPSVGALLQAIHSLIQYLHCLHEVWSNRSGQISELAVIDGYYGTLDDFEDVSRKIKFTSGSGLPGLVWETGMPVLIEDLGQSPAFIRSADARKAGITTALGIPVSVIANQVYITTFLSAKASMMAIQLVLYILSALAEVNNTSCRH